MSESKDIPKAEIVPLSKVKLNPKNPRFIKDEAFTKLCNSLKEFPEMLNLRPVVCDEDGTILGGNMRFRAAKEIGLKEIPVLFAMNLTEDQKAEFVIKDNVSGGAWDWDMLANEWDQVKLEEGGIEFPGIEEKEIKEEDQKNIFPLAIMLTAWEYKKFQEIKREEGYGSDTEAFKSKFQL